MFRLFAAAGFDPAVAVHRTDLLSFSRLHEVGRQAGGHEFQYRPFLYSVVGCRHGSPLQPACFSFPEQQRI